LSCDEKLACRTLRYFIHSIEGHPLLWNSTITIDFPEKKYKQCWSYTMGSSAPPVGNYLDTGEESGGARQNAASEHQ
jgi:hypothetical protein